MEIASKSIQDSSIELVSIQGGNQEFNQILKQIQNSLELAHPMIVDVDNAVTIQSIHRNKENQRIDFLVNLRLLNRIQKLVPFFESVNSNLDKDGVLVSCLETAEQRKIRLFRKFPKGVNKLYYTFDYLGKRVIPKLPIFKKVYFFLTAGRNQVLTRVEILGRLVYCGFEIHSVHEIENRTYVVAKKKKNVIGLKEKSYGLVFKMIRNGYKGKMIQVYKFRTMYAYSEYLQEYVYEQNKLAKGGKLDRDYRVNMLGKWARKFWIDEIPMVYNLLKGDLKLIGVRPLSSQYLSLYGKEFAEKRKHFKPGLIPPYYADLPETIEEIIESENRYFEAYKKAPFKTDLQYFLKCFSNILIKKARSN